MVQGLAAHDIAARRAVDIHGIRTKYVACWGWRLGQHLRYKGHEVLVMERGYLGDRFAWTSLGWNGLNGRSTVPEAPEDGGERFNRNFSLAPLNPVGEYVLIVG